MITCYVFDVDGTLTQSRMLIDKHHKEYFLNFCQDRMVYLLTGSDHPKTKEQLGSITASVDGSYQCGGNEYWVNDKVVTAAEPFVAPLELHNFWKTKLKESEFPLRTGLHEDYRNGLVNYSIVGRNCTLGERKLYEQWDKDYDERNKIAHEINSKFPDYTAQVAGGTGMDIFKKGQDKGRVYFELKDYCDRIIFFGDDCQKGGNDHPFVVQCKDPDEFNHVSGPDETFQLLEEVYESF